MIENFGHEQGPDYTRPQDTTNPFFFFYNEDYANTFCHVKTYIY